MLDSPFYEYMNKFGNRLLPSELLIQRHRSPSTDGSCTCRELDNKDLESQSRLGWTRPVFSRKSTGELNSISHFINAISFKKNYFEIGPGAVQSRVRGLVNRQACGTLNVVLRRVVQKETTTIEWHTQNELVAISSFRNPVIDGPFLY